MEGLKNYIIYGKIEDRDSSPSSITLPRVAVNNPTPPSRRTPKIAGIYLWRVFRFFFVSD